MKKKLLATFVTTLIACVFMLAFTACDKNHCPHSNCSAWTVVTDSSETKTGLQRITCLDCYATIKEYQTPTMTFELNNDQSSYTATSIDQEPLEVIIPSTYKSLPVTKIGERLYKRSENHIVYHKNNSKSVYIPDSVTEIGAQAFGAVGCKEIRVSNNIEHVGEHAFFPLSDACTIKGGLRYIGNEHNDFIVLIGHDFTSEHAVVDYDCKVIADHALYGSPFRTAVINSNVVTIGKEAFSSCANLKKVLILSNKLKTIGDGAFSWSTSLTDINLPNSLTKIGTFAFNNSPIQYNKSGDALYLGNETNKYLYLESFISGQSKLNIESTCKIIGTNALPSISHDNDELIIPKSVIYIEPLTFAWVPPFTKIEVDSDNAFYKSIDGVLYDKDGSTLLCYPCGKSDSSFSVPEGVTVIGDHAFSSQDFLKTITFPDSLLIIGDCSFSSTLLTSIDFPKNLKSIAPHAFKRSSLTSITIPENIESIGESAFADCKDLTEIKYNAIDCKFDRLNNAFGSSGNNGPGIKITIGSAVKKIPDNFFTSSSSNLKEVYFEENSSCEVIGAYAFPFYSSLERINIPNSVTSIACDSFHTCSNLQYNTSHGIKYLGNETNKYLYLIGVEDINITTAVIEKTCKIIGNNSFYDCDDLNKIFIPKSVVSINSHFLNDSDSLTIYYELESKPEDWEDSWFNSETDENIIWGYKED